MTGKFRHLHPIILLVVIFLPFTGPLHPSGAFGEGYQVHSRFTIIQYDRPEELEAMKSKLRADALTRSLDRIFLGTGKNASGSELGKTVDRMFQRVQLILDMPKPKMKVKIRVFRTRKEVSAAFYEIAGRPADIPAFYWRETNTIYLETEGLTPGILAHEMAHAVIDDYFIICPPPKIAEMLCQYVDREISGKRF